MKTAKKLLSVCMAAVLCMGIFLMPASAVEPRWTNAVKISITIDKNADYYEVFVEGIPETDQITIGVALEEKNLFGGYSAVDYASGTYSSRTASLVGYYDMSPSKEYRVTGHVYVKANNYTENITLPQ